MKIRKKIYCLIKFTTFFYNSILIIQWLILFYFIGNGIHGETKLKIVIYTGFLKNYDDGQSTIQKLTNQFSNSSLIWTSMLTISISNRKSTFCMRRITNYLGAVIVGNTRVIISAAFSSRRKLLLTVEKIDETITAADAKDFWRLNRTPSRYSCNKRKRTISPIPINNNKKTITYRGLTYKP